MIRLFDIKKEHEKCYIINVQPHVKELLFSSDNLFEEENKDRDEIIGFVNDLYTVWGHAWVIFTSQNENSKTICNFFSQLLNPTLHSTCIYWHLLYARHYLGCWRNNGDQNNLSIFMEFAFYLICIEITKIFWWARIHSLGI